MQFSFKDFIQSTVCINTHTFQCDCGILLCIVHIPFKEEILCESLHGPV